jgi:hypothetical protein
MKTSEMEMEVPMYCIKGGRLGFCNYCTEDDRILSEVRTIFTVDIFLCFLFGSSFYFHFSWIGFLVSIVIFQQGLSIFKGAFYEMTDASAPEPVLRSLSTSLDKLREDPLGSGRGGQCASMSATGVPFVHTR